MKSSNLKKATTMNWSKNNSRNIDLFYTEYCFITFLIMSILICCTYSGNCSIPQLSKIPHALFLYAESEIPQTHNYDCSYPSDSCISLESMQPLFFAFSVSYHHYSSVIPSLIYQYLQVVQPLIQLIPLLSYKRQLLVQHFILSTQSQKLLVVCLCKLLFGHFLQFLLFGEILYLTS